jgi:BlaI family penicillinase repressor
MAAHSNHSSASRHSILDLAPLELDCMNALWPSGEATVRQIQEALRPTRPRAYTTIMTILDRLAQKGVVQRRKAGRAWVYTANVSVDEARTHAVSQVIEGFFGGNAGELASYLTGEGATFRAVPRRDDPQIPEETPAESAKSPVQAHLDAALL